MTEKLVNWIVGLLGISGGAVLGKYIVVFIISLLPILELRGGLIAASLLKLDPLPSYIISIVGNLLPIPFILWLISWFLDKLKTTKTFSGIATKLENKALSKKDKIEKYGFWGLVLFVGIPLPGTGAWTGSLIASLLEMDRKKAFLAIVIGVVMASVIMMLLSFGVLRNIIG